MVLCKKNLFILFVFSYVRLYQLMWIKLYIIFSFFLYAFASMYSCRKWTAMLVVFLFSFHYSYIYICMYVWLENEFILSFNRYSIERMMVCVRMLCVDDMCTFHVLYIERKREREKERHSTVDEKKSTPG
jgi:hypothetical protein